MPASVFDTNYIDFKQQPLFFGAGRNIQEYVKPKYPIFVKLDEDMDSLFWRAPEVSLQKDRSDYRILPPGPKFMALANIKYQIAMDSVQGRSPLLAFLPIVTNPELESCIITWGYFEKIHSKSYTYLIRNLYSEPSEVLDNIINDSAIVERAKSIGMYYDKCIDTITRWQLDPTSISQFQLYKDVYLALISVYILEGVRFFVSFACNFAFSENKMLEGTTKIMSLIARDEAKHLALVQHVLKILHSGAEGSIWTDVASQCKEEIRNMFLVAMEQEKIWAAHLCTHGSMLGLTENSLHQYIEHMVHKRMKSLGLDPVVVNTPNPYSWMTKWLNSKSVRPAPQETEIESYLIGAVDMNVCDVDFLGINI